MTTGSKCTPINHAYPSILCETLRDESISLHICSQGGADKWALIRAEKAKLEEAAGSIADQAKDKASQAVDAAKKTVS
jgi:hypothetical protein